MAEHKDGPFVDYERGVSVADELEFDALPERTRSVATRVVLMRKEGESGGYEQGYEDGTEFGKEKSAETIKDLETRIENLTREIDRIAGELTHATLKASA